MTRLDWPDGEFYLAPCYWSRSDADALLDTLVTGLDWRQHQVRLFGRELSAPRLSAWYGDDEASYAYSGTRHAPIPWLPVLSTLRDQICVTLTELGLPDLLNGVLANRYRNGGDSMGWHSDDERELGDQPVIASANFGAQRRFVLRHCGSGRRESVLLGRGSLLIMAGASQACWQHAIPKTRQHCAERVNLTFRHIRYKVDRPATRSRRVASITTTDTATTTATRTEIRRAPAGT